MRVVVVGLTLTAVLTLGACGSGETMPYGSSPSDEIPCAWEPQPDCVARCPPYARWPARCSDSTRGPSGQRGVWDCASGTYGSYVAHDAADDYPATPPVGCEMVDGSTDSPTDARSDVE
jgi:hypothetical protein